MDCNITSIWNCPKCGTEKEVHINWMNGEHWLMCLKCKKSYWIKSRDLIKLPTQKREAEHQMPLVSSTAAPNFVTYMQVIPDSQYFTELEQILACLQLNWNNQEYMITALKNSIEMGYKMTKP